MRHRGRFVVWGAAAMVVVALPAGSALAADATGCSGSVESLMADGSSLDSASAPGSGGTQSDPLVVDPEGSVAWEGSTDAAIISGTWSVTVMGVPFLSGDVDNAAGDTASSGVVDLAGAPAPVQWVLVTNAKIPVSGEMTGAGGSCVGSGFIAGTGGSPTSSPIFYAGAGFAIIGLAMFAGVAMGTKATVIAAAPSATPTDGGGTA